MLFVNIHLKKAPLKASHKPKFALQILQLVYHYPLDRHFCSIVFFLSECPTIILAEDSHKLGQKKNQQKCYFENLRNKTTQNYIRLN